MDPDRGKPFEKGPLLKEAESFSVSLHGRFSLLSFFAGGGLFSSLNTKNSLLSLFAGGGLFSSLFLRGRGAFFFSPFPRGRDGL